MDEALEATVRAIERPHRRLLVYYALVSVAWGPLFPLALAYRWIRYATMRYRFDAEGVSMSWGRLFRREIVLSYVRFQDIHLSSNVIERWLGLARVEVQTASGSSRAEMVVEGVPEYELVRDFFYDRMRGGGGLEHNSEATTLTGADVDAVTAALVELAGEIRQLRESVDVSSRGKS